MDDDLLKIEPVPTLRRRIEEELKETFDLARPIRFSRAPGRLDIMGGIADYTGALVCQATLELATAIAVQERDDRQLQIFSFNLLDQHQPFTFAMPLDALAHHAAEKLRREFAQPGRRWAGYVAGCLYMLHQQGLVDLTEPRVRGINVAIYSTLPMGAGVASSAALEISAMMNFADHFGLRQQYGNDARRLMEPMKLAWLCQQAENQIVGSPCGIMDQVACCLGVENSLLRLVCQPHELQSPLRLPTGIGVYGINSNIKHSIAGSTYGRTRCAAFMGHRIILEKMKQIGAAGGQSLIADPMNGYLANLPLADYKKYFRQFLPDELAGIDFLEKYGPTVDNVTVVNPDTIYQVQHATDHHVFDAHRIRNFVEFLEQAAEAPANSKERSLILDKAGHLMYASHVSYRDDAMLGSEPCDLLVDLVRKNERSGLYGARITGGGAGGTVAVLAETSDRARQAITEIATEYERQTGLAAQVLFGSSNGAWHAGTAI
ncbi:MAG TPA: galactokinase family protein [Tepidisphaeraceae bacterium]|jgi:L-arabinokinase